MSFLKDRRGVAGYPLLIVLGLFVTALIIGVLTGTYPETLNFFKAQITEVQDERLVNAALSMTTINRGHMELEMSEYEIKVSGNEMAARFGGTTSRTDLSTTTLQESYETITGPDFEKTEGLVCMRKPNPDRLEVTLGAC